MFVDIYANFSHFFGQFPGEWEWEWKWKWVVLGSGWWCVCLFGGFYSNLISIRFGFFLNICEGLPEMVNQLKIK